MSVDWEDIEQQDRDRSLAAEEMLGDYVPTTAEVETAFHEFASSLTQAELAYTHLGKDDLSYPAALADWWAGMVAFRRWLADNNEQVRRHQREKIMSLHREVHAVFSWNAGIRSDDPCSDCRGAPGVHECGCWADEQVEYVCAECHRLGGPAKAQWPCPTVSALTADPEADR